MTATGAGVPKMQPSVDYPSAGVSLSLPQGFEAQTLVEPFDIARGVLTEVGRPVQAVTMSCYPIAEKVTAERFADAMVADLQKVLAITKLNVTRKTTLQVAGVEAQVRLMSFEFRSVPTVAAKVFLTREEKNAAAADGKVRLCYVLTAESSAEKQGSLTAVLGEVVKTIKFIPIQQPMSLPIKEGAAFRDYKLGYVFRPPAGWFVRLTPNSVESGQTDFVLGGIPMPLLRITAADAVVQQTAEQAAQAIMDDLKQNGSLEGLDVKTASQGAAKLGPLEARQVVVTQTPATRPARLKADEEPAVVIAYRAIGATKGPQGALRSYSMAVYCQSVGTAGAEAILNKIAATFDLLAPAATSASAPAITTSQLGGIDDAATKTQPATDEAAGK